ncbi:asparagine synthase (glutamine-hydrolyzing) [Marinivivus vitaminiproducens]|uniref:asparagine synthase (glutamine-hydrolyzing) n=1 Tax=Marinivivus vitaminiproducens TaxID=3035935 RepID=UPI0027A26D39|nr:asparagine synthase (glutamine-hydrolyzing) [Geminicoccaceae bacterium SCSIO 64248]
MCGIAGWIQQSRTSPGETIAKAMSDAMPYRGPDGDGWYLTATHDNAWTVGLVHRRLAIIDPVGGVQPMHSDDGRLTLSYNGEIYNFRELRAELEAVGYGFRTNSDTEVLLQAYAEWGPGCVSRFRGMFAFALWDRAAERLVVARDAFGKKPVYVYEDDRRVIFGSEIKTILVHPDIPRELDRQSVLDYLTYRYVPGPHTLFRGIRKLPPGSYAVWQNGELTETRYYQPPDATEKPSEHQPDDPVGAFLDEFDEAVRMRMVSDVPFGAFLSGGIDSSAVVGLMSRHSDQAINTFSVGFKEAAYSELDHARLVAETFKCNHTELVVSADELMGHLPTLIERRDAPVAEPSDIPIYLLSCEARKTVKMVLTGEGSDELLAGYPKHRFEPMASKYQSLVPGAVHRGLVEPLIRALPYRFRRVKTLAANFGLRDEADRFPRWFGAQSAAERDALVAVAERPREAPAYAFAAAPDQSPLRKLLYFDQVSWLPDNLLERGDRMTMAGSIEARMPFLDTKLAAFIASLDDRNRLRGGTSKWLLRQAMTRVLPESILNRPKVGFRVPVNEWFQTSMRGWAADLLTGPDSLTRDLYHRPVLARILEEHGTGAQNHEKLIWTLVNLELFQRAYRLS